MSRLLAKFSFVLLGLVGACATPLRIKIPVMRFESPELSGGEKSFGLTGGLQSFNEAELSPDMQKVRVHDVPATSQQEFIGRSQEDDIDLFDMSYLFMRMSYTLPETIPLELTWRLPDRLGLKFQMIGPRAGEAKAGSFSASLTTSYAKRDSGGSAGTSSSTAYSTYDFTRSLIDGALIIGYRPSDSVLFYGGPFYFISPYKISQNTSTSTTTTTVKGQVDSYGANLGVQWGSAESVQLRLETAYNTLKAYKHEETYLHAGFAISKNF